MPFLIAAGVIVVGIAVLSTAHGLLTEAERVQAGQVAGAARTGTGPAAPAPALVPVPVPGTAGE